MNNSKVLKKIMVVIIVIAMLGTSGGIVSLISNRTEKDGSKTQDVISKNENEDGQKSDEESSNPEADKNVNKYKEIKNLIKDEIGVLENEVFEYDNTAVGTVIVDESIGAEKAQELANKYQDKMKNELDDGNVIIKVVDKNGNILNETGNESEMPKASVIMIDTSIPQYTYVQVKIETDKPEDYKVIVSGVELEKFISGKTNEILFDCDLDGEYSKEQLVPVVLKKQI